MNQLPPESDFVCCGDGSFPCTPSRGLHEYLLFYLSDTFPEYLNVAATSHIWKRSFTS